jgi:predicted TIM-barrel fold metal-dependent hydrolase
MAGFIISADSHTLEPGDLWEKRMSPRFRDRAPHIIHEANGQPGDFIVCEPLRPFSVTSLGSAGIDPDKAEEFSRGGYAVCRPGGWDPAERIKDMELDGVDAEILYPGLGMYLYALPDPELQADCFRAYNDWAAEYSSYNPDRLLGVAALSIHDVDEAVREMTRARRLGLRGILISANPPAGRRYSDPAYEPLWAEAERLDMPVSMHILTGSTGTGLGPNILVDYLNLPREISTSILEMIAAAVMERHPRLKVISAENDIGWLAHYLKRLDHAYYRWKTRYPQLTMPASEYWRRQVYCTFQDDVPGVITRHLIGVDSIMWASDYPHFDSTWPHSPDFIKKNFDDVPEDETEKMLRGNMERVYNLSVAATAD